MKNWLLIILIMLVGCADGSPRIEENLNNITIVCKNGKNPVVKHGTLASETIFVSQAQINDITLPVLGSKTIELPAGWVTISWTAVHRPIGEKVVSTRFTRKMILIDNDKTIVIAGYELLEASCTHTK